MFVSLQVGAEFLAKHYSGHPIFLPDPTWANHNKVFPQVRPYDSQHSGAFAEKHCIARLHPYADHRSPLVGRHCHPEVPVLPAEYARP